MELENSSRVRSEFQELGRLHLDFMKKQMDRYGSSARLGGLLLYFALFLSAFGVVRLLDGLAEQLVEGVVPRVQIMSGCLLLLLALLLFIVSALFLRKTKKVAEKVFYEIREDMRWLKKLL